ncbi:chloride channel protein [Actinomadura sp. KC345]|uniref:chloride channel protein n=1 Tax=Actinomadura sp. KC345 TaxID=2530371 RepID=UPI00104FB221|nr:chloride channel protein [Actinomadura sp. KC345]TDC48338.1 chloride channel protein [Actinomadura sp. KC345]
MFTGRRRRTGRKRGGRGRAIVRWALVTTVVGVLAGVSALGFQLLLAWSTSGFLGVLVGFEPAATSTGGQPQGASGMERPWLLPLVTGGGAALAALVVLKAAPETGGHGTDAAIDAAHHDPSRMRARVPLVKALTSSLTLGSGGSGGTEGPIAQIGGGVGSVVARRAGLPERDARTVVMTGLGAGIGAIFRAPLGGAVLGAELLYRKGVAWPVLLPALASSAVAFAVCGAFLGFGPLLGEQWITGGTDPVELLLFVALGVLCGLLGRVYISTFYGMHHLTERWVRRERGVPPWAPPIAGGLAVGGIGLAAPAVLGPGYGVIQQSFSAEAVLGTSLWLVLLLPLVKILATALSIGTGGSGGLFGPGLFIGAVAGAAFWRVCYAGGATSLGPEVFAVIGAAALLGPTIHAPVGVTLLVLEATRSPGLVGPVAVAMLASRAVIGRQTLYRSQLDKPARFAPVIESVVPAAPPGPPPASARKTRAMARATPCGRPMEGKATDE